MLERLRVIVDVFAERGVAVAFETGQERADTLLQVLADLERPSAGVNFDPANMILYGTGDPIEALGILAPHVISVHAKDGDWPPKDDPNALGTEKPLGQGSVGMPAFIAKLREIGYKGTINIEREVEDLQQRYADMASAVVLLEELRG